MFILWKVKHIKEKYISYCYRHLSIVSDTYQSALDDSLQIIFWKMISDNLNCRRPTRNAILNHIVGLNKHENKLSPVVEMSKSIGREIPQRIQNMNLFWLCYHYYVWFEFYLLPKVIMNQWFINKEAFSIVRKICGVPKTTSWKTTKKPPDIFFIYVID